MGLKFAEVGGRDFVFQNPKIQDENLKKTLIT